MVMGSMRFHVLGLPFPTTREKSCCAYNSKNFKFCKMMFDRGHVVIHYGVEGSNPECSVNVDILPAHKSPIGHHFDWDVKKEPWEEMNRNAMSAILKYGKKGDFLCVLGGTCQQSVAEVAKAAGMIPVEYGIGYYGTFAEHQVFESYWHMAHIYGKQNKGSGGSFTHAVIPNYFDKNDFTVSTTPGDYILFVGRMIKSKGLEIVIETAKKTGKKLILAGPGAKARSSRDGIGFGPIVCDDGMVIDIPNVEYHGAVGPEKRNELMSGALVGMTPTIYLEPFGGVAVELQFCGTPCVSTDWGAFSETIEHGKTGYRCRWLEHFVWAVNNVHKLDRQYIADRARKLYSLEKVGEMYEEYFSMLSTIREGKGWYADNDSRTNLNWLER